MCQCGFERLQDGGMGDGKGKWICTIFSDFHFMSYFHMCKFKIFKEMMVSNKVTISRNASVQFSCSIAQLCLTLCDPLNRSTPGLPVHHPPHKPLLLGIGCLLLETTLSFGLKHSSLVKHGSHPCFSNSVSQRHPKSL